MSAVRTSVKYGSFWHWTFATFSTLGVLLAINQLFRLQLFGFAPIDNSYLYLILTFFLSPTFILYPAFESSRRDRVPWYDILLFVLSVVIPVYFAFHGKMIIEYGWEYVAPAIPTICSIILWFLIIEALRRSSGLVITVICLFFSLYPIFAGYMPGFLQGQGFDFITAARNHAMSVNSILGVPLTVVGNILIGFMLFGVVLQATGGGDFFLNISNALLGHTSGGPAKVGVVTSALFGTLSGSAISNVVTTGSMTIPAMKKTGYEPHYAAAVEACASTGGTIMPPVMGAAAFVMASFLNRPYADIVIAAAIPAILYFMALFFQVHAHAVKIGLKGMPKSEVPPLWATFKSGWYYIFVILILFYFLFTLRVEAWAPFYASLALLIFSTFNKKTRLTFKGLVEMMAGIGKVLSELVTILAGVGLLVGALSVTGVAFSFSREIVSAVGNNLFLLLAAGALTSFILGMGMTSTACYIFLAIVMAPALVNIGVDPIAAHFFVLYWGVVSFITPPVALAAFAGAGIAQSDPMKTGITSMRLGIVTYFIPFFFVYNTALLAQAGIFTVLYTAVTASVGVFILSMAMEGLFIGVGKLNWPMRVALFIGSPMMLLPELKTDIVGVLICGITIIIAFIVNKASAKQGVGAS